MSESWRPTATEAATCPTARTAKATTLVAAEAWSVRSTTVAILFFEGILAPEEVEAIYHMQHGIAVDTVGISITALHGIDRATEVAHVVEYVIKLQ